MSISFHEPLQEFYARCCLLAFHFKSALLSALLCWRSDKKISAICKFLLVLAKKRKTYLIKNKLLCCSGKHKVDRANCFSLQEVVEDSLWMRLASMSAPLSVLDRNIYFWPRLQAPCSMLSPVAELLAVLSFLGVFFLGRNIDRSCQNGASSLLILKSAEKMKQAARSRRRPGKNKVCFGK